MVSGVIKSEVGKSSPDLCESLSYSVYTVAVVQALLQMPGDELPDTARIGANILLEDVGHYLCLAMKTLQSKV